MADYIFLYKNCNVVFLDSVGTKLKMAHSISNRCTSSVLREIESRDLNPKIGNNEHLGHRHMNKQVHYCAHRKLTLIYNEEFVNLHPKF